MNMDVRMPRAQGCARAASGSFKRKSLGKRSEELTIATEVPPSWHDVGRDLAMSKLNLYPNLPNNLIWIFCSV